MENKTQITFDKNHIPRCLKCSLIPLIEIINENSQIFINYKCENKHEGKVLLENFIEESKKNSIFKIKCNKCQKEPDNKKKFDFCPKCNILLCIDCSSSHDIEKEHKTISLFGYDGCCFKHCNSFCYYCTVCAQNLCIYCLDEHKEHKNLNLFELNKKCCAYVDQEINKCIEQIGEIKNMKNEIIKKIDDFIELKKKEIQLLLDVNETFKFENKFNNLNYNIIKNLENIYSEFSKNNKENFKIFLNKSNSLISLFKSFPQKNNHLNRLQSVFSTPGKHWINCITFIDDYNFLYCSGGTTKYSIEYRTSNFDYANSNSNQFFEKYYYVHYALKLKDGKIIICPSSNMVLISGYPFKELQTVNAHKGDIWKIVQTQDNIIISVSDDGLMKKWNYNSNNNYLSNERSTSFGSGGGHNIIQVNQDEIATYCYIDKKIKFWTIDIFNLIETINDIETENIVFPNQLCMINENYLCACGINWSSFNLINIKSHKLEKRISFMKDCFSMFRCLDGSLICGLRDENRIGYIANFKFEDNEFVLIKEKKLNYGYVVSINQLKDGKIIAGSHTTLIHIWD